MFEPRSSTPHTLSSPLCMALFFLIYLSFLNRAQSQGVDSSDRDSYVYRSLTTEPV